MPPRVGSALDHLAAAIVALAVFALPISLILLGTGHTGRWSVAFTAISWPVALLAIARTLRRHHGLERVQEAAAALTCASVLAWVAALVGGFVLLMVGANSSRCIGSGAGWTGVIGALALYAIPAGWSLPRGRTLALWVLPAATLLGLTWMTLAFYLLPAGPGFCGD